MKRILITLTGIGILFGIMTVALDESESSASLDSQHEFLRTESLGFSVADGGSFVTVSRHNLSARTSQEVRLTASRAGDIVRLTILSHQPADDARRYMAGQALLLKTQYDSRVPPYPEFLTNQTGCAEHLMPVHVSLGTIGEYYLVYADERYNYGLCSDEQIHYKAGFALFYCSQSQRVIQMEYFVDKDKDFEDVKYFLGSFTCTS